MSRFKRFNILVNYDDYDLEVKKITIQGGYVMPSLEMADLLTDVINDLTEKQNKCFKDYVKSIKVKKRVSQ